MKELIKALLDKITETTGLVSKYSTDKVQGNTPLFNLAYKGINPKDYSPKLGNEKLKRAILKFDLIYQGQLNSVGDMINYIENEINLMKLFKYVLSGKIENKGYINIDNVGNYTDIKLYVTWNNNDVSQQADPFTESFSDAKRIFKLELEYKNN